MTCVVERCTRIYVIYPYQWHRHTHKHGFLIKCCALKSPLLNCQVISVRHKCTCFTLKVICCFKINNWINHGWPCANSNSNLNFWSRNRGTWQSYALQGLSINADREQFKPSWIDFWATLYILHLIFLPSTINRRNLTQYGLLKRSKQFSIFIRNNCHNFLILALYRFETAEKNLIQCN